MDMTTMIRYNEPAAGNACFSLPGALSVVPVRFSFPAPELNFGFRFTVSAGIHADWLIIREGMEQIFVSVAGSVRTVSRKICRSVFGFRLRKLNILRARILKLSYAGRRL